MPAMTCISEDVPMDLCNFDLIQEFNDFVETQLALNLPGNDESELPLENPLDEWYDVPDKPLEELEEPKMLPQGLFSSICAFAS